MLRNSTIKLLSSSRAAQLDRFLMSAEGGGFSIDQLMELAGLAVAQAVYKAYPPQKVAQSSKTESAVRRDKVLILVGPGNNGGDGLVAARHLQLLGYDCLVFYPKRNTKSTLYTGLVQQMNHFDISFLKTPGTDSENLKKFEELTLSSAFKKSDIIIDAIFGFSYKPPIREPFHEAIQLLTSTNKPVVSVDVPSSWNVDNGPVDIDSNGVFMPSVLVSLTAPKGVVKSISQSTRHFVGGRFVSEALQNEFDLDNISYIGTDMVAEVSN
ncbi:YjeF N-terminal domain-like protein [Nadsonia fulvescens var. elongata DSM 6958]|uniref:NAD(P)H-hydrate epimerase n=1 Tax=Nadsonia fulvescens var. elongata DSM 6958 TaxID=857566 RepID=A0A1E3PJG1_9ASCO|nr:YjeF N-terminal domain-like protein [Nadsonia fulvescens var. elongata DSM 6958]